MSLYKRGGIWWYKFKFQGQSIRESTRSSRHDVARGAERSRRRELEQGYNGLSKQQRAQTFSVTAEHWLEAKKVHLSPRSVIIEQLTSNTLSRCLEER